MLFHMRLLYQIRMGYVDLDNQNAHQSIQYYPEEHVYDHEFSIQSIGRAYEVATLKDLMPLDFYLNNPVHIVDELIEGMLIGREDKLKMEKDREAEAAAAAAMKNSTSSQFEDLSSTD